MMQDRFFLHAALGKNATLVCDGEQGNEVVREFSGERHRERAAGYVEIMNGHDDGLDFGESLEAGHDYGEPVG